MCQLTSTDWLHRAVKAMLSRHYFAIVASTASMNCRLLGHVTRRAARTFEGLRCLTRLRQLAWVLLSYYIQETLWISRSGSIVMWCDGGARSRSKVREDARSIPEHPHDFSKHHDRGDIRFPVTPRTFEQVSNQIYKTLEPAPIVHHQNKEQQVFYAISTLNTSTNSSTTYSHHEADSYSTLHNHSTSSNNVSLPTLHQRVRSSLPPL